MLCGKKFASEKKLRYHLNVHAQMYAYECEICGKTFQTPPQKSRHMIKIIIYFKT